MENNSRLYGLMAEFESAETLLEAARLTHAAGYRDVDAYSPFPIDELGDAIGARPGWVAYIILAGGIIGCLGGFLMQWSYSTIGYPINVGGKPYNSWPAFIPVTFELTILGAVTAGFLGMLILNGFPELYHPVFNLPSFGRASQDRFFLAIEARDPKFDLSETRAFMEDLHAVDVSEVEK